MRVCAQSHGGKMAWTIIRPGGLQSEAATGNGVHTVDVKGGHNPPLTPPPPPTHTHARPLPQGTRMQPCCVALGGHSAELKLCSR